VDAIAAVPHTCDNMHIVITYFWIILQIQKKKILLTSKKNLKQCRSKRHCSPSSPAHVEAGEEEVYSPAFPRSLSLPKSKKPETTRAPHLAPNKTSRGNKPCGWPWGGCLVAFQPPPTPVPWLNRGSRPLSPFFFYKYRHKRGTKGGE